MTRRPVEAGFTLIELLVALLIFAMLSAAGVMLLRGSVAAEGAVRDHLDRLADVQVAMATMDADLGQATTRISRTQGGTLAPAFFGRAAGQGAPILQFVRTGWTNPDTIPRPSVQKVEYWWRSGRLERVSYPAVDGAAPDEAVPLLMEVDTLALRFRDARGQWLTAWTPTQPDLLPSLVEMTLTRHGRAPLVLRFLIGPGGIEQPQVKP